MTLGPYAIAISSPLYGTRQFAVDTSFEPYRREAFRHRSIPAQRQSVMMTNIVGEGTINTEGLWRREQTEWSMGAGQYSLDRKGDAQETRFYSSKGVDVFSYPLQATLLPDTKQLMSSSNSNIMMTRCNKYVVVVDGSTVKAFDTTSGWSSSTTMGGFSGTVNSITANDYLVFLATTSGLYYATPATSFSLYANADVTTNYTGGYDLVRVANDQVIAARNGRLYAFQKRSSTSFPYYGAPPSVGNVDVVIKTASDNGSGTHTWSVTTVADHGLSVGQPFTINSAAYNYNITSATANTSTYIMTCNTSAAPNFVVGDTITVTMKFTDVSSGINPPGTVTGSFNENGVVTYVGTSSFQYQSSYDNVTNVSIINGLSGFTVTGSAYDSNTPVLNGNYVVASSPAPTSNTFAFTDPSLITGVTVTGGTVTSSTVPDVLATHPNDLWKWSDAVGGATQVYFAGYVVSGSNKYGGCIYRSDLPVASITTSTNLGTQSVSSLVQPFNLNYPIQALPMSPDEYPTCIAAYLNYIFIGTNRGIRMAQTLNQYDPNATASGDLKSGPVIPNILQPVSNPVRAIVGDGRFVWFGWSNYDASSTGLGRLDLSTFIAGDPLSPAYASDLMVTGQGEVIDLDWDPGSKTPIFAVAGKGIYGPNATNVNGILSVGSTGQYVSSGYITSGIFDYGIPDLKIPMLFDYGAEIPAGSSLQAQITYDPTLSGGGTLHTLSSYNGTNPEVSMANGDGTYSRANQFQAKVVLNRGTSVTSTPVLHRWTMKSWPAAVQGTNISVVLQLYQVNVVDGLEIFADPYDNFNYLEQIRQSQDIITYTEGPLTVQAIIESLDWIPHKRRDNYENGFEGDLVLTIKTLGAYNYTPVTTS
jgi:hypothetical protein